MGKARNVEEARRLLRKENIQKLERSLKHAEEKKGLLRKRKAF